MGFYTKWIGDITVHQLKQNSSEQLLMVIDAQRQVENLMSIRKGLFSVFMRSSDRQAWTNSADPGQSRFALFAILPVVLSHANKLRNILCLNDV